MRWEERGREGEGRSGEISGRGEKNSHGDSGYTGRKLFRHTRGVRKYEGERGREAASKEEERARGDSGTSATTTTDYNQRRASGTAEGRKQRGRKVLTNLSYSAKYQPIKLRSVGILTML
jgi:hypothetical protein